MTSIRKGRELLSSLLECLKDQYTPGQLDALIKSYNTPRKTSFRFNRLKVPKTDKALESKILNDIQEYLRFKKFKSNISKQEWNSGAFILTEADAQVNDLYHLPCHTSGQIHFQSLSSMIPPIILNPTPGSRVLDMCAAPGGKTFQLLESLESIETGGTNQNSTLIANDISSDRLSRLYRNMNTLVPRNLKSRLEIRSADARKFQILEKDEITDKNSSKSFDLPFDYILLDAPCSGEGIISLKDPKSYRDWSLLGVKKYARLQSALLEAAYSLLSKGGSLVYSTCTLNSIENEGIANTFVERHADLELCSLQSFSHFALADNRFLKIFPDSQYQGFFICKFKKS